MSRVMTMTALAAVVFLLTACGKSVPKELLADADFGEPPLGYEQRVKGHFRVNELEYAHWAKPDWRIQEPFKAAFQKKGSETWHFGYGVNMKFNRKRELQGYAFNEKHRFFFQGQSMTYVNRGDTLQSVE